MSKKKPLSADEKRSKMLEIFHETRDVFQLKKLEKIAPKEKGIVLQSVKAIVQELADDGHIQSEKIGTNVYFWSFPSKSINDIKRKLEESEQKNEEIDRKIQKVEASLEAAILNVSNIDAITVAQNKVAALKVEKENLEKELMAFGPENDPEAFAAKQQETKKILEAANRWTDNIFCIKTWCKRKFAKEDRELNKAFGIPDDLDYLEEK